METLNLRREHDAVAHVFGHPLEVLRGEAVRSGCTRREYLAPTRPSETDSETETQGDKRGRFNDRYYKYYYY